MKQTQKITGNFWTHWNLKPNKAPSIDEFYEHFKIINTNTIDDDRFENDIHTTNDSNMYLNAPLTEHEINKCINNLKKSKASSPSDNILNEYIKSTKEILLPLYCKLFNCIIDTGIIPQTWSLLHLFQKLESDKEKTFPNFRFLCSWMICNHL